MDGEFQLHPRLARGSYEIGQLYGCRLLLKDNALFPWFLLVPEVPEGIEDLHQLEPDRHAEVTRAIREVSEFCAGYFRPTKLNVACIGNQVRQMHLHIVARFENDPAWPGTVWAHDGKRPYDAELAAHLVATARAALDLE